MKKIGSSAKNSFFGKNHRGNILIENVLFLVLTLIFLTILFLFLFSRMGGAAVLEEKYAKQIVLLIDSAKPGMIIALTMEDVFKKTGNENFGKVVLIQDNLVTVKIGEGAGYSYSFFNNIEIKNIYQDENKYVFVMGDYK